jgi:hypothetical protein
MLTENTAIEAMHRALREARDAKKRIEARLVELESEFAMLRSQSTSLEMVIDQTSSALRSALFPTDTFIPNPPPVQQQQAAQPQYAQPMQYAAQAPPQKFNQYYQPESQQAALELEDLEAIEAGIPVQKLEPVSGNVRFNDFRIPQAATIVLREAGHALHVSEIYQRMAEGGFEFRGQHQLITLAVSLSRAKRFRKVAPGTFELDAQHATGQVA